MRPGFADPVLGAQSAFRAALEALARPGRVQRLPALPDAPPGLDPAAAALALTLCDDTTPLWTDAAGEARAWLAFHCGAPDTAPARAAFWLAAGAPPDIALAPAGTDEAPQEGATLILCVAALEEGAGWTLTGPGIEAAHHLRVDGLPPGFAAAWAANNARFPRGVDVFLCCGDRLAALSRTTRIAEDR